jgi:signal transduction histidine kinase
VLVDRTWDDGLRIRVENEVGDGGPMPGGRGLVGMRERLDAVGGQLDVDDRTGRFVVTARVPVRR